MDFVTIDFETATPKRNSPCEIGLTFVRNNKIDTTKSWLIKPIYEEFYHINEKMHGISYDMVKDSPDFAQLWSEILPLIDGKLLVAHNASFDMSVLSRTLETYDIPKPNIKYACTLQMAKYLWPDLKNHKLATVCKQYGIGIDKAHRAGADSLATALLLIHAIKEHNVETNDDLAKKLGSPVKTLKSTTNRAPKQPEQNVHKPYLSDNEFKKALRNKQIKSKPKKKEYKFTKWHGLYYLIILTIIFASCNSLCKDSTKQGNQDNNPQTHLNN